MSEIPRLAVIIIYRMGCALVSSLGVLHALESKNWQEAVSYSVVIALGLIGWLAMDAATPRR